MNKLVKGAIAAGVGVTLMLGGAGTFAVWNATATVSAGTVTAGNLAIHTNSDGVWKDARGATITPSTYRIVPGSKLTYTQTLSVTATGDNLSAVLTNNGINATGDLANLVTKTMAVTSASSNVSVIGDTVTVTSAATPATINVVITVDFPSDATAGQNGSLNLTDVTFTLTQQVTARA